MFRLNLKIALRNLWINKGFSLISIAGLAIALAIFILCMLYANYERSYDAWNPGKDRLYRVNYRSETEDVALSPGNMATSSKENIAAVEASTRVQDYWKGSLLLKTNQKDHYVDKVLLADSNFLKVFEYPLLYGNAQKALNHPQSLILSKELSENLFGKGVNPVGEKVILDNNRAYTIDGVIDVARYPSHFQFNMIWRFKKSTSTDFYGNNYYTYVKLYPNSPVLETQVLLNQNRTTLMNAELLKMPDEDKAVFREFIDKNKLYLQPVKDIHLTKSNVEYEFSGNGIGTYLFLMLLVALLVLVIAAVNFTNLSITIAIKRAKEAGVRKVLGAFRLQIAIQFILEITLQCCFSVLLAIVLMELFLPSFNTLADSHIQLEQFRDYAQLLIEVFILLVVLVLLSGLYPALLISNVMPVKVLKGNFSNSDKGSRIRNGLVVLQFFIAVLFILGIWVIGHQLKFMQQKDLGYKPQQVLAIRLMKENGEAHYRQVKNVLQNIEGVQQISRADHIPGEDMGGNSYSVEGKTYSANFITIDGNYTQTMGMKMIGGRSFSSSVPKDTMGSVLLTETAAKTFGLKDPVGKMIKFHGMPLEVIGLVKDFNHYSPEKAFQPIVFQYVRGNPLQYVLVQVEAGQSSKVLSEIETAWHKLEPDFPIRYTFLDRNFETLLHKQAQLGRIIGILSTVTIMLALMGIFALAALSTQRRRKEISIRKVLGASMFDILRLLNTGFIKLVLLANLLAWPVAYFLLKNWLDEFAFRIEVSLFPFLLAAGLTSCLTVLVVSMQSYRTASSNPADALKYE